MKGWIMAALAAGTLAFLCGCNQEGAQDPEETVKEIQSQNRPQDAPVPEELRARGGNTPARGKGVR